VRKLTSLEPIRWLNRGILTMKIGRGSKAEDELKLKRICARDVCCVLITQETQTSVERISLKQSFQLTGKSRFHRRGKMQFRIKAILVAAIGVLVVLARCSKDDDNPMSGDRNRPSISRVSWTQDTGCVQFTPSKVTISVTVNDPDNAVNELTFSGSVSRCSGSITGPISEINCPQLDQYGGSVTVTDPDGNSDSISFTFGPCQNGVVTK